MAIKYCSCNGKGCLKCRGDGFIDVSFTPRSVLPTKQKLEEFKRNHCSDFLEEFQARLGQEFGSNFAIMYGLGIWTEMQNQRR